MPIIQLENPTFISVTGAGRPNSGGTVGVYVADGLFTTLATIYSDQVKTSELSNPVTLDDAGTKEIWYDVKVDIREKTSAGVLIRDTENLDPNASQASVQGFNLAQNGSFEIDSTNDGQPDNWTISPYTGSSIAITNDVVTDGVEALEFNTGAAGSGGGTATSAKFPVTEGSVVSVAFSFYATHATTTNTFQIRWYDEDDVLQSTSTVTMPASGSVPTSWTTYQEEITVDAAATQGEIVLVGIASGGSNLNSKAYFDGISIIDRASTPSLSFQTAQATTSGTTVEFTDIPAWVKRITLLLDEVSSGVLTNYYVQIGDSGGYETTGYKSVVTTLDGGAAIATAVSTASFLLTGTSATFAHELSGSAVFTKISGNRWICNSNISDTNNAMSHLSGGNKELSGTLTTLKFIVIGTLDNGQVNAIYER